MLNDMYIFLSWIHLTAAMFWVGGMLFLSLVAVPTLKGSVDPVQAQGWFIALARRFRTFVWVTIGILIFSGLWLLPQHLQGFLPFSGWPTLVIVKLMLVFLLIVTSVVHDRIIGPKVRGIKQKVKTEWTSADHVIVKFAPWVGRITMILGLAIVLVGAILVRS